MNIHVFLSAHITHSCQNNIIYGVFATCFSTRIIRPQPILSVPNYSSDHIHLLGTLLAVSATCIVRHENLRFAVLDNANNSAHKGHEVLARDINK